MESRPPTASGHFSRWRWLPGICAVLVFLWLTAVLVSDRFGSVAHHYQGWMSPVLFHDWQVVRLGWMSDAAGHDPLSDLSQPFNYPRFVLFGRWLGLLAVPLWLGGLVTAAVFLAAAARVLAADSRRAAILAALLLLSPPVFLLVERGNLDAWAWVALALGLAGLAGGSAARGFGAFALLGAALLKLYPIVGAAAALVSPSRSVRWWAALVGAAFLGFMGMHQDELALVLQKTTRGLEPSYGYALAASRYNLEVVRPRTSDPAFIHLALRLSLAGYALFAAGCLAAGRWRRPIAVTGQDHALLLFRTGALIYAATFALPANWAYRLVFLLLCAPLLLQLTFSADRRWPWLTLGALVLSLWLPFHLPLDLFFAGQAVEWGLAGLLLYGVGVLRSETLPDPKVS